MNKSKILKRSLAVILAMMMIFAMIPLSASAADAPVVEKFYVNNVATTLSNKTFSVSISTADLGQVKLGAIVTDGATAQYKAKDATEWTDVDPATDITTWTAIATLSNGKWVLPIRAYVKPGAKSDSDEGSSTEYTLEVTPVTTASSNDATIKRVKDVAGMTSYVIDGTTITINVPFGTTVSTTTPAIAATNIVPNNTGATVGTPANTGTAGEWTVVMTAKDGSTLKYTVQVVAAEGITDMIVDDGADHLADTDVDISADGLTITRAMDYGYESANQAATKKINVPLTLTHGANISKVTATNDATAADISDGKTKVELEWDAGNECWDADVYAWVNGTAVTIDVNVAPLQTNYEGELTQVIVTAGANSSNPIDISAAGNVAVEMPSTYDATSAAAQNATIRVYGSKNATVSIPAQNVAPHDIDTADGDLFYAELTGVDISKGEVVLRVVSEDQSEKNQYTLKITTAATATASLTDYSIKGTLADGTAVTYSGKPDSKNVITLNLPYELIGDGALANFKVYATYSVGCHVYGKLDGTHAYAFNGRAYGKAASVDDDNADKDPSDDSGWAKTLVVENDTDNSKRQTYTVKFAFATPKTARNLSAVSFTNAASFAGITSDNTYKATIKTGVAEVGTAATYDTIQVAVPFSYDDTAATTLKVTGLTVSEGAAAYVHVADIDPDTGGDQAGYVKLTAATADNYAKVMEVPVKQEASKVLNNASKIVTGAAHPTTGKTTDIYVVSEANAIILGDSFKDGDKLADGTTKKDDDILLKAENHHLYKLLLVKASANKDANLLTVASTLDPNVKATLDKSSKTVTITVPYSYVPTTNNTISDKRFTLNFTASPQATVTLGAQELVSDNGSETVDASAAMTATDSVTRFAIGKNAAGTEYSFRTFYFDGAEKSAAGVKGAASPLTGTITVESEDGNKTETYTLAVVFADAKTEAKLLTAKVGTTAATISGDKVTVALPYGTKLNPVSLALTASDMATINVSDDKTTASWEEFKSTNSYDLNNPLYIQVVSEDQKTKNVYELTATVAEQFSDVKDNAWYAKNVAAAAAAGIISGYTDGTFRPNGEVTRAEFAQMLVNMLGVDTSAYTTSAFKDVNETAYYSDEVAYIKDAGITAGYPDGTFRPNGTISRQEAAVMLAKALKLTATTDSKFADDAAIASWAKTPAYQCKAAQIFNGDGEGNFLPGANLTRAQAASIMVNSLANK